MSKIDDGRLKEKAGEIFNLGKKFEEQFDKWLFGLEDVREKMKWAIFTAVTYMDSQNREMGLRPASVLMVGPPGVGKTAVMNVVAMMINALAKRVSFTNDILPYDLIGGTKVKYDKNGRPNIEFVPGPIFTHILLADEINRGHPKSKSALLEPMEEQTITVDGVTYPIFPISGNIEDFTGPRYFQLIGTQNPIEQEGTYETPEAEMDRYAIFMDIGYPKKEEDEMKIRPENVMGKKIEQIADLNKILECSRFIQENIEIPYDISKYITQLLRATRPGDESATSFIKECIKIGISPRANYPLSAVAKTIAVFDGCLTVTAEHVKRAFPVVCAYKLILNRMFTRYSDITKETVINEVLRTVKVPPV